MIAFMENEHLRLVGEPPEGGGMDDAVAIAAKGAARRAGWLGVEPAAACAWIGRKPHASDSFDRHVPPGCARLTFSLPALNYESECETTDARTMGG